MAFSRGLGVIGVLTVSWLTVVGCSDDDKNTQQDEQGGEAGESAAGKSAEGGKGGGGGKGGTAGSTSAGTAGTAGSTSGGAGGGDGPELGGAGAGGDVPVSGGAGAGAGGDGGAGGEPPVVLKAKQCAWQCQSDDDCLRPEDDSHKCNPTTKRCEDPLTSCSVNQDCIPFANFLQGCETSEQCDGWACVTLHGAGYCAEPADVETGCTQTLGTALTLPNFGAAGTQTVCVSQASRCNAGSCIFGCADELFGGCEGGDGNTCNETTGLCECAASTECTANGVSVCGADSHCGCAESSECTAEGQSVCVAGSCGCADASECGTGSYESATPVCE